MDISDLFDLDITSLIIFAIIGVVIWLAIREVKLWYWRINEIINEQNRQTQILDEILTELKKSNTNNKKESAQ